jgi:hypothetical protein
MPKRSGKRATRLDAGLDTVQNARRVVDEALRRADSEPNTVPLSRSTISQAMAEMGRKGGKIGGKRRMDALTAKERSALGRMAVQTRWAKKKKKSAA